MEFRVKWVHRKRMLKAIDNLASIDGHKVEYGYFATQGDHMASGLSYAALMAVHELRVNGDYAARPVFKRTLENYGNILRNTIKLGIMEYVRGSPLRKQNADKTLSRMGIEGVLLTRKGFGDTSMLEKNTPYTVSRKGFQAPLEEFGDLRANLSYRTSIKNKVRIP